MNVGMMWEINRKLSLSQNVANAAAHYEKKYGRMPNMCIVNPTDMDGDVKTMTEVVGPQPAATITVQRYRYVVKGVLIVGVDEIPDYAKAGATS